MTRNNGGSPLDRRFCPSSALGGKHKLGIQDRTDVPHEDVLPLRLPLHHHVFRENHRHVTQIAR
jgi:hypothetical protein